MRSAVRCPDYKCAMYQFRWKLEYSSIQPDDANWTTSVSQKGSQSVGGILINSSQLKAAFRSNQHCINFNSLSTQRRKSFHHSSDIYIHRMGSWGLPPSAAHLSVSLVSNLIKSLKFHSRINTQKSLAWAAHEQAYESCSHNGIFMFGVCRVKTPLRFFSLCLTFVLHSTTTNSPVRRV